MTDPNPIRRPGVDVVQAIRAEPGVVTQPVLIPIVVGPCFKVLEATQTDGTLNTDARLGLPAVYQPVMTFVGVDIDGPFATTDLEILEISVNNGPSFTVTFAISATWTLEKIVDHLNSQIGIEGASIKADVVMVSATNGFLRVRTDSVGELATLELTWTSATTVIADALKVPRKWIAKGYSKYNNDRLLVSQDLLPDPWSLRPDLDVVEDSVRGFLTGLSAVKKELARADAVSRCGSSYLKMEDDRDGDGVTPLVKLYKDGAGNEARPNDISDLSGPPARDSSLVDFDAVPTAAILTSATVPAWGATLVRLRFWVSINGWQQQDIDINKPTGILQADVLDAINDRFPQANPNEVAVDGAVVGGAAGSVAIRSFRYGREGVVRVGGTDAAGIWGPGTLHAAVHASTTAALPACTYAGGPKTLTANVNGVLPDQDGVTLVITDRLLVQHQADAKQGGIYVVTDAGSAGRPWILTRAGDMDASAEFISAVVKIAGGTALIDTYRFCTVAATFVMDTDDVTWGSGPHPTTARGNYQQLRIGDEIWIDGVLFGVVSQIVVGGAPDPGGAHAVLRMDREYAVDHFNDLVISANPTKHDWYVVSKSLDGQIDADGVGDKPSPEMYVSEYLIQLRHDSLRGTRGEPMYPTIVPTLTSAYAAAFYRALRLDVTVKATTRDAAPVLIQSGDFSNLETQFAPLDVQNPAGLGGYFMLLNSGAVPILIMGVDEISDTYPEGTPEAYARAYQVLQASRCYALAPMSQDLETALITHTHVAYMSRTKQRGERIAMFTVPIPERDVPTLVGSGTEGNAGTGASPRNFDTGLPDLSDLFLAAGVTTGTFNADGSDGVYLNVEGDPKNYLVAGYSGSTLSVSSGYTGADAFWATVLWASAIIDKTFSISVRGALLVDTAGNPDRAAIAKAIGKRAAYFKDRRIWVGAPGNCEAVVDGIAQRLPTYYLAAATMAQRCALNPSRPQSNSSLAGFTNVFQSRGYFDEDQMDQAAGYGIWWWITDETTGVVVNRHQLTSDVTSVKTREGSITCALDFTSYAIRDALRPMLGTMTVNPKSVELLSMAIEGVLKFLTTTNVLVSYSDLKIAIGPFKATEDDLAAGLSDGGEDEILVEFTAVVGPPLNRVRIRIMV